MCADMWPVCGYMIGIMWQEEAKGMRGGTGDTLSLVYESRLSHFSAKTKPDLNILQLPFSALKSLFLFLLLPPFLLSLYTLYRGLSS